MRHNKDEIEQVVSEYIDGASIQELCAKYNLAFGTVQAWLIKRNCIRNYKPYRLKTGSRITQDYILHDDYAEIKIRRKDGLSYIKIDLDDVEKCREYGIWSIGGNGYAASKSKETGKMVYLHRFVMNICDNKILVDHINHNLLDCRKSNLRIATMTQNMMNQHKRVDNTTGVRGVTYDKGRTKWVGHLTVDGVTNRKRFDTFNEAVAYRKELEDKYFGEFNFDEEKEFKPFVIIGMEHFQNVCRERLVKWYNENGDAQISYNDTYVVWSCKTLQNYKALLSTNVNGDGVYAEYTFNGDKGELYEDVYKKLSNRCITE